MTSYTPEQLEALLSKLPNPAGSSHVAPQLTRTFFLKAFGGWIAAGVVGIVIIGAASTLSVRSLHQAQPLVPTAVPPEDISQPSSPASSTPAPGTVTGPQGSTSPAPQQPIEPSPSADQPIPVDRPGDQDSGQSGLHDEAKMPTGTFGPDGEESNTLSY